MSFSYTENQSRAITGRGSALLVSAAAGSGKTRVLTQRVMEYITDPDSPESIDRFLIITYTRAAATEMRSRIMDALASAAAEDPGNTRLRREQDKCCTAQIGTIHSFCTAVIRENCHHLGLPPTFRVLDEDRAATMKSAALERLLEQRYEHMERHPGFRQLADTVGAGRDDRRLSAAVLGLYEKMRSHPYPRDWAEEQAGLMESVGSLHDVSQTPWGAEILDSLRRSGQYWIGRLEQAVEEIYALDEKLIAAYGQTFADDAAILRDFVRALDLGWDKAREFLPPEKFAPLGRLVKYPDPELKERLQALRKSYKKAAEDFRRTLAEDSAKQLADMAFMAPAMTALLSLCLDLDSGFSADKRREGCLDFSDLEHLCARLLVDRESGKPTWIAVELSQRYREIMVDEYQDVNAVQDMIFRAVSREGTNLFMVGDVKQSIYRFRLADPGIFLQKYNSYADWSEDNSAPRRIMLQENFRSRKSILDAANLVFSNIMSRELGELEYDEDAALRYGALGYPEGSDCPVEMCIIDPVESDDEDTPEKSALEARYVASEIRRLMALGTPVYENGDSRPCRWSDFVILMRSPGSKASLFHRELALAGIPVQSTAAGGFFTSLEVAVAIDMLAIIDNPHADVPLISVLRSPAFGFSADELSAIRCADRKADFYSALLSAAVEGNLRCRAFADMLSGIRAVAPDLSLTELIWRVYSDTDLFALCAAMADGESRRDNLFRLFELAASFEETGQRGVFRFVAWLRRMAERGQEPVSSSSGDAVAIMSVHKSKGLEFPFVFLCDLHHRFNKTDSRDCVLMHSDLGLGPRLTDTRRGIEYPTIARRAIEKRIETENLSEEMRILYVAMTRARERLYLCACRKNAGEMLEKLSMDLSSPVHPEKLRAAPSFLQWLCYAALAGGEDIIKLSILPSDLIGQQPGQAREEGRAEGVSVPPEKLEEMEEKLSFRYPNAGAVEKPGKVSATELKGLAGDETADFEARSLLPAEAPGDFRYPRPSQALRLSATQRGTAAHSFLQFVDLDRCGSQDELVDQLQQLSRQGHLSPEEASAVNIAAMERFFSRGIGLRIRQSEKVLREFRFTLLVDADDPLSPPRDESMLLQGVVDCLLIEPDGITLIDYKTDRISAGEVPLRAQRYAMQLRAYAHSIERIFSLPVKSRVLHFLSPGESYILEND